MNALDTALVKLAAASTALERTARPKVSDVKEAEGHAKAAHKILQASMALLEEGVYTVAEEPTKDTPLFTGSGDPAPGAEVSDDQAGEEEAAPEAAPHALEGLSEDEALVVFEKKLEEAETAWKDAGRSMKAFKAVRKAWAFAWNFDSRTAFDALALALATPGSEFPAPAAVDLLHAKYPEPDFENTPLVDLSEIFGAGPMRALADEIDRVYTADEDREPVKVAWENSFDANPRDTWFATLAVLADSQMAVDLPDPLPAAPALPVVEAPAAAEGSAA